MAILVLGSASGSLAQGSAGCHWRPMSGPSAFPCMLATAKAGNLEAMFETAVAYRYGSGVPRDFVQSTYWSRKAAERGHPVAISMLIGAYRRGEGVPRNLAEAVHWDLVAAHNGDVIAMGDLVRAYRRGEGVPRNDAEADRWLKQYAAAEPGSPDPAGPPEALEQYWRRQGASAVGNAAAAARDAEEALREPPSH